MKYYVKIKNSTGADLKLGFIMGQFFIKICSINSNEEISKLKSEITSVKFVGRGEISSEFCDIEFNTIDGANGLKNLFASHFPLIETSVEEV